MVSYFEWTPGEKVKLLPGLGLNGLVVLSREDPNTSLSGKKTSTWSNMV